jgi:hypothetical protein
MERQPSSSTSQRPSTFYTSRRALCGFRKRPLTQTASGQNLFLPPAVVVRFTFCFLPRRPRAEHRRRTATWWKLEAEEREGALRCSAGRSGSQAPDGRAGMQTASSIVHCGAFIAPATHGAALPLP